MAKWSQKRTKAALRKKERSEAANVELQRKRATLLAEAEEAASRLLSPEEIQREAMRRVLKQQSGAKRPPRR